MSRRKPKAKSAPPKPAPIRDVAIVRFYLCGDIACLDTERHPIRTLSAVGVANARALLPQIRERLIDGAMLVEQDVMRGGAWPPLTEDTLARFEGRMPQSPRRRVVPAAEWGVSN